MNKVWQAAKFYAALIAAIVSSGAFVGLGGTVGKVIGTVAAVAGVVAVFQVPNQLNGQNVQDLAKQAIATQTTTPTTGS